MVDLVRVTLLTVHGTQMVFEVERSQVATIATATNLDRHLNLRNMTDRRVAINTALIFAVFVPIPEAAERTATEVLLHGPSIIHIIVSDQTCQRLNRFPSSAISFECIWYGVAHQLTLAPAYLSLVEIVADS